MFLNVPSLVALWERKQYKVPLVSMRNQTELTAGLMKHSFLKLVYHTSIESTLLNSYLKEVLTASLMAQIVKNLPEVQETWVWSLQGKIPWRREWHPTPVFLPGKSQEQRSLAGSSPWGCKELDMTEHLSITPCVVLCVPT